LGERKTPFWGVLPVFLKGVLEKVMFLGGEFVVFWW
jgi:hypothetical protein